MRRRRNFRGPSQKGPSRFASAKGADGRSLGWEGLQIEPCYVPLSTATSLAFTTGTVQVRFQQLVPLNITRGVITLERMFIQMAMIFNQNILIDPGFTGACAHWNVQLVPSVGGAFDASAVINPRNIAELSSARQIWRHSFWPSMEGRELSSAFIPQVNSRTEFDIKSRRRFDRDEYSLVLAVATEVPPGSGAENHVAFDVRGLFRSGDGV